MSRSIVVLALLSFASIPAVHAQSTALPRSAPERQGISSAAIRAFVIAADSAIDAMHSFMLVRHGNVVAEGWWTPYDSATTHVLFSLSKSFTSTAVGLAIGEGKMSLDDEVLKVFSADAPSEPSANLRQMRVRDLLRMNTGHQTEPAFWLESSARADSMRGTTWVRRFLMHPVPFKPGTHFLYNTPATYMLSAIVQKRTGQRLHDYLRPRLFEPLGIERAVWDTNPEGITIGGYGLRARTEDIAKLGQLYLQRGMWKGRRILPEGWADSATARQSSNGSSPTSDWDQGYGYQFWRSRHGYRGDGAFGQYMLVLPKYDAVIAITSGVRDMQAVMNLVWEKLLPAMQSRALPDAPATHAALKKTLAGLTMRSPDGSASSPLAQRLSGRWYEFPDNDRGIRALALELSSGRAVLVVRSAAGETRTPVGQRGWVRSRTGFLNGMERFLSVPAQPEIAASGAWTSDSVFTLKLVAPETPFYSTLDLRFVGDRVTIESRHHVNFGPTQLPRLEGRAVQGR